MAVNKGGVAAVSGGESLKGMVKVNDTQPVVAIRLMKKVELITLSKL